MTTKTNAVREQIKARLGSITPENGYQSHIGGVLNPVDIRDKTKHAAAGLTVALWTLDGAATSVSAGAVIWRQPFAIDVAVPWQGEQTEAALDVLKLELASALLHRWEPATARSVELSALNTAYPEAANAFAIVSCEITITVAETLVSQNP